MFDEIGRDRTHHAGRTWTVLHRHQARRRLLGYEHMNRAVNEISRVALLAQAVLVNAGAVCDELVAAKAAPVPGDLSFEHQAAQAVAQPLHRVVRDRPHRWPKLRHVGVGLGRAWALRLLCSPLQLSLQAPLHAIDPRVLQVSSLASAEHHQPQPDELATDVAGQPSRLGKAVEVARQMLPADFAAARNRRRRRPQIGWWSSLPCSTRRSSRVSRSAPASSGSQTPPGGPAQFEHPSHAAVAHPISFLWTPVGWHV